MPIVEKCCCGCPLRGGSLAIVIIDFISTTYYVIRLYAIAGTQDLAGNTKESPSTFITFFLLFHPLVGIVGILKKVPIWILLYVYCSVFRLCAVGLDILLLILFSYTIFADIPKEYQIGIFAVIAAWAVHAYYTLVVYSYYQELKQGGNVSAGATVV